MQELMLKKLNNYVISPQKQMALDLELADYVEEIQRKFSKSKINKTYKFPRKNRENLHDYIHSLERDLRVDSRQEPENFNFENQNSKHVLSELRSPINVSIDEIQKFRKTFNKSQMHNQRNHLDSIKYNKEGSRNRSNLGKNPIWAKVSSKSLIFTL